MATLAEQRLKELLDRVAAPTPAPGGGSSAAIACALAAALVQMCADIGGLPPEVADRARELRARALELADRELSSYAPVLEAQRLPPDDPERAARIASALTKAAQAPREIAEVGAETAALAARAADGGGRALRGDALTAQIVAEAAGAAAAALVAINLDAAAALS
jgi:formiminotetrahydrofolate cyclodeaminase